MNLLKDREGVKGLYRSLLGKIRAEGYDHSELLSEGIKFVNDRCVTYRITFTRWKKTRVSCHCASEGVSASYTR